MSVKINSLEIVAPFVGAWIEIVVLIAFCKIAVVAPFVGAWIEINLSHMQNVLFESLPLWERGLK